MSNREDTKQGFFNLTFDNSNQRYDKLKVFHCQGALFKSGRIYLDTMDMTQNHSNMILLRQTLKYIGNFSIEWEQS